MLECTPFKRESQFVKMCGVKTPKECAELLDSVFLENQKLAEANASKDSLCESKAPPVVDTTELKIEPEINREKEQSALQPDCSTVLKLCCDLPHPHALHCIRLSEASELKKLEYRRVTPQDLHPDMQLKFGGGKMSRPPDPTRLVTARQQPRCEIYGSGKRGRPPNGYETFQGEYLENSYHGHRHGTGRRGRPPNRNEFLKYGTGRRGRPPDHICVPPDLQCFRCGGNHRVKNCPFMRKHYGPR